MLSLKNHPFAVAAYFRNSLVVTYAVPKEELEPLLPECLELDTLNDQWGFLAVAMVDTRNLRPKGFPVWMENDFILTGYRIFVRYTDQRGKRLRGLFILGSETNKKRMSFWGNIFTHYHYKTTDIKFEATDETVVVSSDQSALQIEVTLNNKTAALPSHSPFKDWKEARHFAGPLPFTFTYNSRTKQVLIIEGVRENWTPQAVEIIKARSGFIEQFGFKRIIPANAFIIRDIPYYWKKGKRETWKK